jgi:large subunit ribosomal protein L20
MTRVKRGAISIKRRRNLLKKTKGYRYGRSTKEREARQAFKKAGAYAFAHRRLKKRSFRRLWTIRINAIVKTFDLSYSKFIKALKDKNIELDRKVLSQIVNEAPEVFAKIVEKVK